MITAVRYYVQYNYLFWPEVGMATWLSCRMYSACHKAAQERQISSLLRQPLLPASWKRLAWQHMYMVLHLVTAVKAVRHTVRSTNLFNMSGLLMPIVVNPEPAEMRQMV